MGEHVMVPREPTEAMVCAGMSEIDWCRDDQVQDKFRPFEKLNQDGSTYAGTSPGEDVQDAYRAMLAAAPALSAAPAQGPGQEVTRADIVQILHPGGREWSWARRKAEDQADRILALWEPRP